MHRFLVPLTALVAAFALSGTAGAHPVEGFITDIEGDANGLNGQQVLVGADPTGSGTSTAPLSYGPADIRAIDFKTTYTSVPIGDDGIDYQATGVQVIMKTEQTPKSDGPTLIYRVGVNVGGGCNSFLQGFLRGASSLPNDPADKAIQWRQLDAGCPDAVVTKTMPFAATVSAEQSAIIMDFDYSKLTPAQRAAFEVGSLLSAPAGSVRTNFTWGGVPPAPGGATAPAIDVTVIGGEWEVGSDMPADVPCTINCP